jgi:UDP-N-acetylmuramoyl-L-alanyl-D-glutamate--2,6-diaminopimelate ligase
MLSKLLSGLTEKLIFDPDIKGLALDSRKVASGYAFIAISGTSQHGICFAEQAIKNGVTVILYDPDEITLNTEITDPIYIAIEGLSGKLGLIAARFYDFPSNKLSIIGITGTNGKTTCSLVLAQLLPDCAIIGTLGWGEANRLNTTENTTPDVITIQKILGHLVDQNKKNVVMEVSSHGLEQGRTNGVEFNGVIFTNITRDHLDYHGSMEAYVQAKLKLLLAPGINFIVVNMDTLYADEIISASPETAEIIGFSRQNKPQGNPGILSVSEVCYSLKGIDCQLHWQGSSFHLHTSLVGEFNLENILAVICVLLMSGKNLSEIVELISNRILAINGRMERLTESHHSLQVFIDYAHTPDALERTLKSLKPHCENKLSVIFGCGGDRDKGKRSLMGAIAAQWADQVILTDDNPRFEQPEIIINDILEGCPQHKVAVINDRKSAINQTISAANDNDIVLIAGKGHEDYQEINGIKYPFNDREIAVEALKTKKVLLC